MLNKKFYSVKEASKILGVSTNTIYKYLDAGSLQGKRFNDRGRFKIPYSEIEPYLARETSFEAADSTEINETQETPQVAKKNGSNLAFFESFGIPLAGLLVIYLLWSFGKSIAVSKPTLLTDIGSAILGYSDRTYSKFGNLVYQALPGLPDNQQVVAVAQNPAEGTEPVNQNDTLSSPTIGFVSAEKSSDLNYKIADTEGRINGLYANMQVLSSNAQRLLGKSKTLTSAELNSEIDKMLQFLGLISDSTDKGTIFAEMNWLSENWDFSSIENGRRAAGQVGYLLTSLRSQSLAAFSKPDLEDLDNLVIETDLVLGAIGNPSDTLTQKTIFGGVKEVKALALTLDTKMGEIDNILGSWEGYTASEKENTIELSLSESLDINRLASAEEAVLSKLAVAGTDAELKNSLLSIRAVLEANKIHISQKAGDPLVAPWLDSDGNVRILAVNPSLIISQKAAIKYYLPEGTRKEQIAQIDGGLTLSLDNQKNQYYVEGSPLLAAGGIKTIGLKIVSEKPLAKVVAPVAPVTVPITSMKQTDIGQVAGAVTSVYPIQNIVIWGSGAAILVFGLVLLVFYLISVLSKANKKHSASLGSKETSVLLPLGKSNVESAVSVRGSSRMSFSLPHFEFRAVKKAMASIRKFIAGITSFVRKIPVVIKTGLLAILNSIITFFSKLVSSIKKFFNSLITGFAGMIISIAGSIKRGFLAIIHAIKAFFLGILSAVRKLLISVKSGILTILKSIVAFFVKIVTSVKNFIISIVMGVVKFAVSVVNSIGRGFGAFKRAVTAFFVRITSAVTTFFANIASAIVKTIIAIKNAILRMIVSVKTFFLKILSLTIKTAVSIVTGLVNFIITVITSVKKGIGTVVNAVITFIANIISAVTKAITSVIISIQKTAISITTFFLKILSKVVRAVAHIIRRLLKVLTSVSKFADFTLNQMDFKTPAVRKPHSNYRNTATLFKP